MTEDAVLEAVLEAFAERGYDGTSIRELARGLGVSHNLIPQRFGSKEQLWFAAVDQGFGRLAAELMDAAQDAAGADLEKLRRVVVRFVEANALRPSLLRIINQEAASPGPRLDYLFDNYIEPVRAFGETVLAELRAQGQVRSDSVALFYFLMVHGAGGPFALPALARRFGEPADADPAALRRRAEAAVDILFHGFARDQRY